MRCEYIFRLVLMLTIQFSFAQTNLLVGDFTELSNWSITRGKLVTDGVSISTETISNEETLAFASLSEAIGAGDVLVVAFDSNQVTNFATMSWAGVSLYTDGSSGTEQVFIGSPYAMSNWGTDGAAIGKISFDEMSEEVSVVFTYNYDSGEWTLNIGGETKDGIMASNLAINTIRIGAGLNNSTDIAISNLSVTKSPAPTLSYQDFEFKDKANFSLKSLNGFIEVLNIKSKVAYNIYNVIGTEIKKGAISNNEKIDIRNFTNGLYFLKFDNGNTIKFIKK